MISPATHLIIKGARQHNLKNVDLVIPKNKMIVFTGLSGSGKSSLAFDTIYAEGQRRYVESLSSYARQFLGLMQKPDVDSIDGLSPAISIDQKTTSHNPRSTVGTITEIYDYLRLLFARIGHPHCPNCHTEISPQTIDQITENVLQLFKENTFSQAPSRWYILSPVIRDKKGEFSGLLDNLKQKGLQRVRVDTRVYDLSEDLLLIKTNKHTISAIFDRLSLDHKMLKNEDYIKELKTRIHQSLEQALDLADGLVIISQVLDKGFDFPEKPVEFIDHLYSQHLACPKCNLSLPPIEPRLFSFNTPHGACPTCTGLGNLLKIDPEKIVAPELSLSEGAIIPLASALSNDSWYRRKFISVLDAHNASISTPYNQLPESIQHLILYGDPNKFYYAQGSNREGREARFSFKHEGIINELNRRYVETTSDFMRTELEHYMTKEVCPTCQGTRLKKESLSITIDQKNISDIVNLSTSNALDWIGVLQQSTLDNQSTLLSVSEKIIAQGIVKEIYSRLNFLTSVGLDYLTLSREASTLAGGEAQRIRLASQIGTGLTGVLYVLDEPTIGLHPRDNDRLIDTLKNLRDLGNTMIVVEHDEHVMMTADEIVDFGPLAGEHGGQIVAQGTPQDIINNPKSLTGKYLSHKLSIDPDALNSLSTKLQEKLPSLRKVSSLKTVSKNRTLSLKGATAHNLKNLSVDFPLNKFIAITGVSGSGKSTLIHDTLYPALKLSLDQKADITPQFEKLDGYQTVDKVYLIDQSPIGRTPRSNPATYTKTFDLIRTVFTNTKDAKLKGYKPGRFSFNVKGGRCEACQGEGQVKISMQFLADVYVTCEVCKGSRYNQETLSVHFQEKSIAQVLDMTVDTALPFFAHHPQIKRKLATLKAVGLGYIKLGQPAPTLSGGEAQRVKLAKELSINSPGHTVYLLDEPTTGLHFEDIKNLLIVLKSLVSQNNTVIVIEHNLDVIRSADHIIDLGPEGGDNGGQLIVYGTPQDVANNPRSYTGKYLSSMLL